jgi:Zn-dependent protease
VKSLLLLLFGGLKAGKIAMSAGSMLISLAVYAAIFGWRYAAGFIGLLLLHEMGHYAVARQSGLKVGLPAFIPFVGAWIELKEQPMNVETEAKIAFAGPFVGSLGAFAVYFLARAADSPLLLAVAYAGFFINLFNLLPLSPLDGGRITAILSPRVWFIGAPCLIALMIYRPSPLLIIIGIIAIPQLIKAWKYDPQAPGNIAYYNVAAETKMEYGVLYLGLAALLAIMSYEVHEMLEQVRIAH